MVLESKIDNFVTKIKLGVEFFEDAGRLLVEMLDEDPYVFEEIIKKSREDWMTMDVLCTFEQIGRRQLAVGAMFLPKHVLNRLIALPIDTQIEIASKPVPIFGGLHEGHHKINLKPAAQLSRVEAKRAIGPGGLRTPEEQARLAASPKIKVNLDVETLGRFTVGIVNKRPYIKHSQSKSPCTRVVLLVNQEADIELVKPAGP